MPRETIADPAQEKYSRNGPRTSLVPHPLSRHTRGEWRGRVATPETETPPSPSGSQARNLTPLSEKRRCRRRKPPNGKDPRLDNTSPSPAASKASLPPTGVTFASKVSVGEVINSPGSPTPPSPPPTYLPHGSGSRGRGRGRAGPDPTPGPIPPTPSGVSSF